MSIFDDPRLLLNYYEAQAAEFRMRHDAIFSEIKHYSWLLSILLGSPLALLVGKDWGLVHLLAPYFIVFPTMGLLFSTIAFFVIHREYHLYNMSEARMLYLERALGLTEKADFQDGRLAKANECNFTVNKYRDDEKNFGTIVPWKARIRTLFLSEFVVFGLVALLEMGVTFAVWLRR
jgi:hypothetical protein